MGRMVLPGSFRHCETILSAPLYPDLRSISKGHPGHVDRRGACFLNLRRPADDVDSRLSTYSSTLGPDRARTMLTLRSPRIFIRSIQRCHRFVCARCSNANRLVDEHEHGQEITSVCCFWLGYYVSDYSHSSKEPTFRSKWPYSLTNGYHSVVSLSITRLAKTPVVFKSTDPSWDLSKFAIYS